MKGPALGKYPRAFLLLAKFFAKFRPEKNDSDLCKGVFMEKQMAQIHHNLKKKFQITRFSFDKFQYIARI
jgi:hypothetical protein